MKITLELSQYSIDFRTTLAEKIKEPSALAELAKDANIPIEIFAKLAEEL